MKSSLIIHGHFYQPPRENPWTELNEPEPSAAPFHNWNERIYQECYRANGNARIVDAEGIVQAIENNYRFLSFNFGPTLLSWMEKNHPHGLDRITEADRESVKQHDGHGNAIAQAYNHCILPLCNARDMRTQIRWGLREFRHRFGRDAESIWLPETACNDAVLGACIDEGLRFIILAPGQCYRVRELGTADWQLKENSDVDPGLAYQYFHKDGSKRSLALFFYDGPIARSFAFGEGLRSSQDLIQVMGRAQGGPDRAINVATDGESYGHHTKWGDRTLAYALTHEARENEYHITNYGEYLDRQPPLWEAEVKPGEGTAWSCAHGVGRWIRDCGCETGGQPGWNQAWRGPLREALDLLRDFAVPVFEREAAPLFKDAWSARDDFILLLLDSSDDSKKRFFAAHAKRELSVSEQIKALSLLDTQRQAMLMYTSCGWFFNELSGIETLQILKYACRLMDDLADLGVAPPRKAFLEALGRAVSNVPEHGNGADIFRKLVEPSKVGLDRLAAHLAISTLVDGQAMKDNFGAYSYEFSQQRRESIGKTSLMTGRIMLKNKLTGRQYDAMVSAAHLGGIDFHSCVSRYETDVALEESSRRVFEAYHRSLIPPLIKAMREEFGVREFGLENLLAGEKDRIAGVAFGHLVHELSSEYRRVYKDNRHILEMFQAAGFSLPPELRTAAEYTLSRQFEESIRAARQSHDPEAYQAAVALLEDAKRQNLTIDRGMANQIFGEMIADDVKLAMESPDSSQLAKAISLLELTRKMGIQPNLDRTQEFAVRATDQLHAPEQLTRLAELLYLDPELLVKNGKALDAHSSR